MFFHYQFYQLTLYLFNLNLSIKLYFYTLQKLLMIIIFIILLNFFSSIYFEFIFSFQNLYHLNK